MIKHLAALCCGSLALTSSLTATAKEPIWTDQIVYLYDEPNSCALYVDYPGGDMLRISYKGSEGTVYFSYYSPDYAEMIEGDQLTVAIAPVEDPDNRRGFTAVVASNGKSNGISFSSTSDLLLYLQGTEAISILGPAFTPLARIDLPDFGDVMPRILRCGRQK